MLHHIPKENPQSPDHHAQQRNPADQNFAKLRVFRPVPWLGQDSEVGAAMRAYFCRLIDLFIAVGTGVHGLAGKLSLMVSPTISLLNSPLTDNGLVSVTYTR
jgi:hypothetical protein